MIAPQMLPSDLVVPKKPGWRTGYRRCGLGRLAEAMAPRLIKALGMRTVGISAG